MTALVFLAIVNMIFAALNIAAWVSSRGIWNLFVGIFCFCAALNCCFGLFA